MSPAGRDLVSTIIPVYNRPRLLAEAVRSVLSQTYRPIEVVIVDDGSTDDTAAVGAELAARHTGIVYYFAQSRAGVAHARNRGLREAKGAYIQFLDSDDLLLPRKFATQIAALRAHPQYGVSYCYTREYPIGEKWSGRPSRRTGETFETLFPALLAGRIWPCPSPLFRREVVDAAGGFRDFPIYEDWEYECRVAMTGVRLHHCRVFLADVRRTHRLEGRATRPASWQALRDKAEVCDRILGHARHAGVSADALDPLSRRLFAVARDCARAGCEAEARRSLDLALGAARAGAARRWMVCYAGISSRLGWQLVGTLYGRTEGGLKSVGRWWELVRRWQHRAAAAFDAVSDQRPVAWPRRLAALWCDWRRRRHLTT